MKILMARKKDDIPYKFIKFPTENNLDNCSGPLWTGPIMAKDIVSRITEEKHLKFACQTMKTLAGQCVKASLGPSKILSMLPERKKKFTSYRSQRKFTQHRALVAEFDAMPRLAGTKGAPKMNDLLQDLVDGGLSG